MDIAELNLAIRSDGVVVARDRLKEMGREAGNAGRSVSNLEGALRKISGLVAGAFTTAAIVAFTRDLTRTVAEMESLQRSFQAITGSASQAAATMQYLSRFSQQLGLDLRSTAEAYKILAASAKGTTMEGDQIKMVFESIARASAALGLSAEDTKGVMLALGQMLSKGTVQAEELRGQLGERMPGAFQAAARAMGVTTAELGKMLEKGEVIAADFLPKFAAEMENVAKGAGELGTTLEASMNRASSAWTNFQTAIGDAGFAKLATAVMNKLAQELNNVAFGVRAVFNALNTPEQKIEYINRQIASVNGGSFQAERSKGWFARIDNFLSGGLRDQMLESEKQARIEVLNRRRQGLSNDLWMQLEGQGLATGETYISNANQKASDDIKAATLNLTKTGLDDWVAGAKGNKPEAAWRKYSVNVWKFQDEIGKLPAAARNNENVQALIARRFADLWSAYQGGLSGDKGGGSAAKAENRLGDIVDALGLRRDSTLARLGGDTFDSAVAKIEKDAISIRRQIAETAATAKASSADALEANKALAEWMDAEKATAYWAAWDKGTSKAVADMKTLAEVFGVGGFSAKLKEIESAGQKFTQQAKYGIISQEEASARLNILEAQRLKTLTDQATVTYSLQSEYAALAGHASDRYALEAKSYDAQVRLLEAADKSVFNAEEQVQLETKIAILKEKQADSAAKANLDVQKLVDRGLKDYANKTYDELVTKIQTAIPSAFDTLGEAVAGNFTDMITGAKSASQAFSDMGRTMQQALVRIVVEVGVLIAKMELLRMLGYDTAGSLNGVMSAGSGTASAGTSKSVGMGDSVMGYAKDAGSKYLTNKLGGGAMSAVDNFGFTSMGVGTLSNASFSGLAASDALITTAAGQTVAVPASEVASTLALNSGATVSGNATSLAGTQGAAVSGGVGSALGGVAGGIGLGFTAGNMIWSNGSGTVGSGLGATGGALIGMIGGPIGSLVGGLVGGLLGGGLSGSESTVTSKTGGSGITINMSVPGATGIMGYDEYRQTTSGAFGSSSTKHFKGYTTADPELTRAWNEGMLSATNTLESSLKRLDIGLEPLRDFSFPIMFDVNAENMSDAVYNISNAMAENAITAAGLKDEFEATAKEGEMFIDQIKRLSDAYSSVMMAAEVSGHSLELLSGSSSKIYQAGYASELIDRLGSADAVNSAFALMASHSGQTSQEMANTAMMAYGRQAGSAIAYLGDSSVNVSNFWSKYNAAASGPMSPDDFKKWSDAATAMDAFEKSYFASQNTRITYLQAENEVLAANAQVLEASVSLWQKLSDSVGKALEDIRFDKNLTSLTPFEVYSEKRTKFLNLSALAKSGDENAIEELSSFSKDFLEESRSYYGASEAYFADFGLVSDTLGATKTIADQQLSVAKAQLEAANVQIALNNQQIYEIQALQAGMVAGMDAIVAKMGAEGGAAGAAIGAANASQAASTASHAYMAPQDPGPDLSALWAAMMAPQTGSPPDWLSSVDNNGVDQRALGGIGSGLTWVGEYGPELVAFNRPGRVFSSRESVVDMAPVVEGLNAVARTAAAGAMATRDEVAALRAETKRQAKAIRRLASRGA